MKVFLLSLIGVIFLSSFHQEKKEFIGLGWSSNENYILATTSHYKGLFILNSLSKKIEKEFLEDLTVGYGACFNKEGDKIIYRLKNNANYTFTTFELIIQTGEIKESMLNPQYLTGIGFDGNEENTYYLDDKLNLVNLKNGTTKVLLSSKLSPFHVVYNSNLSFCIVHIGNKIVRVNNDLTQEELLSGGIMINSISKDGRYLYGHIEESKDGHHVSGSEIFKYDLNEKSFVKLLQQENEIAMWPVVSNNGKKLMYSDIKLGQIKTINL